MRNLAGLDAHECAGRGYADPEFNWDSEGHLKYFFGESPTCEFKDLLKPGPDLVAPKMHYGEIFATVLDHRPDPGAN